MRENAKFRREARIRRSDRVRRKVEGSPERPRLAVYRSNRHIFAQLIDDLGGRTLAAASDLKIEGDPGIEGMTAKVARAKAVGMELAKAAKEAGIDAAVFDRAGYRYHGRVAALAEGAREGGLKF